MLRVLIALVISLLPMTVRAEDGVTVDKILFGQTAALAGPASALGTGMREGILAAFKEVNDVGGVKGRKLDLLSRDDGYEPDQAIVNTHKLLDEDKVFALIGGVGTPTANAIQPITTEAKVPFIGPFTGAKFLREPFNRYTVNVRASYGQETEEWIERLTKDLRIKRIAILYQDDTYGLAGLDGVQRALDKRGMKLVGRGTYKRNTVAVKEAVLDIKDTNPEAIVMVGAYRPCAEFIKLAKQIGIKAYFVNISFVGSEALAKELGEKGEGVIISQVVPSPFDDQVALVKSYQKAIKNYDALSNYSFVSLEGYITARLTIEVLKGIKGDVTREAFLNQLFETKTILLDGTALNYGPEDNQGLDRVFLTILNKDGGFSAVSKLAP